MRTTLWSGVALACLMEASGFTFAPHVVVLRRGGERQRGAVALNGMLDKAAQSGAKAVAKSLNSIPLPTSPRLKDLDGGEVQDSLERFVKSAPEGLKRSAVALGKTVVPIAKAAIFGDKKEEEQLPAGWTAHLDEKTGLTFYYEVATAKTVWERPAAPSTALTTDAVMGKETKKEKTVTEAKEMPDSSAALQDLENLMRLSIAEQLPSAEDGSVYAGATNTKPFDSNSMSLNWDDEDDDDTPSWMIDSDSYKPK